MNQCTVSTHTHTVALLLGVLTALLAGLQLKSSYSIPKACTVRVTSFTDV